MNKVGIAAGIGGAVLLAVQLVPYGRDHRNSPVRQEPEWSGLETRALVKRACFDCHSNETRWPWCSNVAPVSWIIQRDVNSGRSKLNFSEWDRAQKEADEAAKTVANGEMPPRSYLALHPEARLSSSEQVLLIQGLQAIVGAHNGEFAGKKTDEDDR
jgi:hypothetical protein